MGIRDNFKDIVIVDEEGRIEYYNISSMDFFDLKPEEMIGTKIQQHYSNLNEETSTLMRAVRKGVTSLGEVQELNTEKGKVVRQDSDTFCIRDGEKIVGAVEFAYYDESVDLITTELEAMKKKQKKFSNLQIADMVGETCSMRSTLKKLEKIVDLESPVLLIGETGTGKEMTARAIHNSGHRRKGSFIYVNCSALPENLFESILFGVKRGSFTDAAERDGLFMAADKGTIFLDEIQSMPLATQGKILRVLEEKRIRPIGAEEEISVDVRIIASCNMDLDALLESECLRNDLYFRLAVIQLELPPLRERRADIIPLTEYYIRKFNEDLGMHRISGIDQKTQEFFMNYDWPGNIRELKNTIESAFYVAKGEMITFADVEERFREDYAGEQQMGSAGRDFLSQGKNLKIYLDDFQKECIIAELKKNNGNLKKTARRLGLSDQMMKYNIKKFGIEINEF